MTPNEGSWGHRARYNALSRYYDALVDPFQGRLRRRGIDALDVAPGDTVLDVGCGTGRGTVTLQSAVGPAGTAIGIDVAERMCRRTRNRGDEYPSSVVWGDALALPFRADSVDAVLVSFTLELFVDRRRAVLDELRRVLVPGGRICVVAPSTAGTALVAPLYGYLNDLLPALVDSRPFDVEGTVSRAGFEVLQTWRDRVPIVPVELVVARRDPTTCERS